MPAIINFKICDNAKECSGVAICKTGALSWNEKKKTIRIDNKKCLSCRKCERVCMVDAIHVAKNEKEYQRIKKEIAADPRRQADLFVDRYGAEPIHPAFLINSEKFQREIVEYHRLVAAEIFDNNSIMCLLKSIPIKDLLYPLDIKYRKINVGKEFLKKMKIKRLPALLFFEGGKFLGKIEGFYDIKKKEILSKKARKILEKSSVKINSR